MGRALNWIIPASVIVAIEYAFALWIGFRVGFHYQLPTKSYVVATTTISIFVLTAAILVRIGQYVREGEAHPTARLSTEARRAVPQIVAVSVGLLLVGMQIGALTWLKVMLPITQGFWADLPLANADRILFGGDAWIVSHQMFGSITGLLDRIYVTWAPAKILTLLIVVLAAESPRKSRALVAFFLTASAGCLTQYLMPSAGPIFYELMGLGSQFAAMPIEPWVATARDYLWADYLAGGGKPGTGISAMPSMHVAVALWIALVVTSYFPRLKWLGWIYFSAIFVGSVHLGWHYAVDSLAAAAIALGSWALAPLLLLDSTGRMASISYFGENRAREIASDGEVGRGRSA